MQEVSADCRLETAVVLGKVLQPGAGSRNRPIKSWAESLNEGPLPKSGNIGHAEF
jgi:hypothetical protein